MENFKERVMEIWYGMLDFLDDHPAVKRWIAEGCAALVVGILAGVITFSLLNHEKKTLAVSDENAATPVTEQTSDGEDSIEASSSMEGDYEDVVIEVVDPSGYVGDLADWSPEEIEAAVSERSSYLENNKYWTAVESYWSTKGVTGNARYCTYLFDTANIVYSASDFDGLSPEVIHIAKNEMYARHGYSFRDATIMNYFMGQLWYSPTVLPADFSETVFTETEVKNLDLLNSLDTL